MANLDTPLLRAHRAGPAVLSGLVEQTIARARAQWLAGFLPGRATELVAAVLVSTARSEEAQLRAHQATCPVADGCPPVPSGGGSRWTIASAFAGR